MRHYPTDPQNKNPEDVTGKPGSAGRPAEEGFVELTVRIENIEFSATGDIPHELLVDLEFAEAKLYKTPCPPSVSVGNVPGLGAVDLCYYGQGLFGLTVGGMRVELVNREGRWMLTIHGGGPHALDDDRLVRLEEQACKINQYFFGNDVPIEVAGCSIVLYSHINPDPSDADSTSNVGWDFIQGRITRANGRDWPPRIPLSDVEPINQLFGSPSGGRQVRFSSWTGGHPLPPDDGVAYAAGLKENSQYQEGRRIQCVELNFRSPFIHRIAGSTNEGGSQLNLPRLLRDLVRATLGDETLPNPFFRAATLESRHLPDSLRPNSAAWEHVRQAFLKAVAISQ